jgi:hypothetical protein
MRGMLVSAELAGSKASFMAKTVSLELVQEALGE